MTRDEHIADILAWAKSQSGDRMDEVVTLIESLDAEVARWKLQSDDWQKRGWELGKALDTADEALERLKSCDFLILAEDQPKPMWMMAVQALAKMGLREPRVPFDIAVDAIREEYRKALADLVEEMGDDPPIGRNGPITKPSDVPPSYFIRKGISEALLSLRDGRSHDAIADEYGLDIYLVEGLDRCAIRQTSQKNIIKIMKAVGFVK
jgi:hypothetical protein